MRRDGGVCVTSTDDRVCPTCAWRIPLAWVREIVDLADEALRSSGRKERTHGLMLRCPECGDPLFPMIKHQEWAL
jgi:hypothetical protein